MRELLWGLVAEFLAGFGLGCLEQFFAGLVAGAWDQAVDGQQQGPVVGPQREDRGVDVGAGQEVLEHDQVRHRATSGRDW